MILTDTGMEPPPTAATVSVWNGSWRGCAVGTQFGIAVCILVSPVAARRNPFFPPLFFCASGMLRHELCRLRKVGFNDTLYDFTNACQFPVDCLLYR